MPDTEIKDYTLNEQRDQVYQDVTLDRRGWDCKGESSR